MTITAERAIELIEEKREIERNRIISNLRQKVLWYAMADMVLI